MGFWLIVMMLMIMIEIPTVELTTIWFAAGAACAALAAVLKLPFIVQFIIFAAVSMMLLAAFRKKFMDRFNRGREKSGAERLVGMTVTAREAINNTQETGMVMTGDVEWAARSETGEDIPEGTLVRITRVSGTKVWVTREYGLPAQKGEESCS